MLRLNPTDVGLPNFTGDDVLVFVSLTGLNLPTPRLNVDQAAIPLAANISARRPRSRRSTRIRSGSRWCPRRRRSASTPRSAIPVTGSSATATVDTFVRNPTGGTLAFVSSATLPVKVIAICVSTDGQFVAFGTTAGRVIASRAADGTLILGGVAGLQTGIAAIAAGTNPY